MGKKRYTPIDDRAQSRCTDCGSRVEYRDHPVHDAWHRQIQTLLDNQRDQTSMQDLLPPF